MRRRLLISMLAVAIAAVLALGIPLGYVLGKLQVDDATQALHRDAQTLVNQLNQRYPALPVNAAYASQLGRALPVIGGVALAAVGVAVVLGLLYARRITRPLDELARAADRLGLGDSSPLGRRYGIQELDRVAE